MPVLDGLRGVAVLLVLLIHAIWGPLRPATASIDVVVRAVAYAGWMGVDLFFVLSGFLITGILLDTRGQPGWWPNFIARRALRIFPLYYGALTVLFVLLPRLVRWSEPQFITLQANRSEEHTSELQSQSNLVCRLLLEKKKKNTYYEELSDKDY